MPNIINLKAKHAIVSDACRTKHTDEGAIDEALARLRAEAVNLCERWPIGQEVKLHFVLSIEREVTVEQLNQRKQR